MAINKIPTDASARSAFRHTESLGSRPPSPTGPIAVGQPSRVSHTEPMPAAISPRRGAYRALYDSSSSAPGTPPFAPRSLPADPVPGFGFSLYSHGNSPDSSTGPRTPSPARRLPETLVVDGERMRLLAPYTSYLGLPPLVLTEEQRQRVPEFDLTLERRPLAELVDPVAILRGTTAHVYEYAWLMDWWRINRTHPHTNERIDKNEFYRVVKPLSVSSGLQLDGLTQSPKQIFRRPRTG